MKKSDVKVCIVRAPGTNCDAETLDGVLAAGASKTSEVVHFNRLHDDKRKRLEDYDALIFPGGFSYGDQVRSGVIWARKFHGLLGGDAGAVRAASATIREFAPKRTSASTP